MQSMHKSLDSLLISYIGDEFDKTNYTALYKYFVHNHTMELLELVELNNPSKHDLGIIISIIYHLKMDIADYQKDLFEKILLVYSNRKN